MLFTKFRVKVSVKYLILIMGVLLCFSLLTANGNYEGNLSIGKSIAAAACIIAYALIEINDVRESNKD